MKHLLLTLILQIIAYHSAISQSVVKIDINQNPKFEVSTNSVDIEIPPSGSVIIGGDLVISGGSGVYDYEWSDINGNNLGISSTITVSAPGTYLLKITDTCDCCQEIVFNVGSSGVDQIYESSKNIVIPNPTYGEVDIIGMDAIQLVVVSLSGKIEALINTPDGGIIRHADFSHLSSGEYLITVKDVNGKRGVAKLLKK